MPPQDIVHGEDKVLRRALTHVTQRLRFARWTRHASRGVLAAAAFAVGVIILQKFILPDWPPLPFAVFCLLLLGLGVGTATAYARPIDLMTAARLAEARLGLKERLSSALEFERSTMLENDPEALLLRRLQQQDAAAHAHAMQPAAAVPFAMPWEAKASLAAWLAIAIVLVLPSLPFMTPPALRVEHAIVQKSGTRLADAARHLQKQADAQNLPETARAARAMQALARRMQNRHLDKRQAMAAVSQAEEQIAEQQRRQAQTSSMTQSGKTLEQAGRELSKSLSAADARSAPSADGLEMRDTARAMQQGDSNGLSKQMRALAQRRNAGPGSSLKNAQDLQRLANALQGTPLSETQRHVQAAADAAKRGNQAEAAFEMRQAADSASRETLQQDTAQRDAQGLQEARQTLQDSRQQMAAQPSTPQNNSSRSAAPQNTPSGNAASPAAQTPPGQTGRGSASDRHGQAGGAGQGHKPAPARIPPGRQFGRVPGRLPAHRVRERPAVKAEARPLEALQ